MGSIEQSGVITPGHLASWTTDGVIQDAGVTFLNTYGMFASNYLGVNFNSANTDFLIPIPLPAGYTRYYLDTVLLSGASTSLIGCTCGLSAGAALTGYVIVASGTAVTVSQPFNDTLNGLQNFTIIDRDIVSFVETTLFFRVQTALGSAATGNISIFYRPLP